MAATPRSDDAGTVPRLVWRARICASAAPMRRASRPTRYPDARNGIASQAPLMVKIGRSPGGRVSGDAHQGADGPNAPGRR